MKKIILATAFLCCTMTMMAEPVSPEAARQAAAKFLNKKGVSLKSEAMRAKNRAMGCNTDSEADASKPLLCVQRHSLAGLCCGEWRRLRGRQPRVRLHGAG